MANTLKELADQCHGDSRPDCPILRDLSGNEHRVTQVPKTGRGFRDRLAG